jgi:ketosteroid isomerase-like protein
VTEANAATLRAGYDALNRGDLAQVMALVDDAITFDPGPMSPDGGHAVGTGRDGFELLVRSWMDAFDDFRLEPLEVIERGPCLVASVRQSGRGRGSGVQIAIEIAHVWTVKNGRAVRLESFRSFDAALAALDPAGGFDAGV